MLKNNKKYSTYYSEKVIKKSAKFLYQLLNFFKSYNNLGTIR